MDQLSGYNCVVITNLVMTLAEVSASRENAICTAGKALQNKTGVKPPCAHYSYSAQIGWILVASYTSRICCCITAPIAEETKYLWFKGILIHPTSRRKTIYRRARGGRREEDLFVFLFSAISAFSAVSICFSTFTKCPYLGKYFFVGKATHGDSHGRAM
jgi:hypothetical protein